MKHLFTFLENILELRFTKSGHTDYQKNELERVRIYPFRILSEATLPAPFLKHQIVTRNSQKN